MMFSNVLRKLPVDAHGFATLHHPVHAPVAHTPLGLMFVGTALAASAIAFAPPYEFDDLDCHSMCQNYCKECGGYCQHNHT